ncbi:DNA (cytosine-5-)-methyltransferase [Deinococcus sp. S9]|nr:DNA (cytosine-5-)-methyltransferase [Deinococcus sp. S9]
MEAGRDFDAARLLRKEYEEHVLTLTSALSALYRTRSLGHVADPAEEIVLLLLSGQAPSLNTHAVLHTLLARPGGLLEVTDEELGLLGLPRKKAAHIRKALQFLEDKYGLKNLYAELAPLADAELLTALTAVPGLHLEAALCVMLFCFGRDVFPVSPQVARVLKRTGILDPFGIRLTDLDDAGVQNSALQAIPPSLRASLHVNAVHHAQTVCRPRKPLCDTCAVKLLCKTGREQVKQVYRTEHQLTLVDMFCGAGGLSDGFRKAGYRTVLAVDADEHAMRTYRLNHPEVDPDAMLCRDIRGFRDEAESIREIIGETQIDVLVGGPPCQGFSRAGYRAKAAHGAPLATEDERNILYRELVDLLQVLQPRAIVMENVPGMGEVRYEDGSTFVEAAMAAMKTAGYAPSSWLLNAASYGVPQERIRRIIVGVREGEPLIQPPPPTHHAPSLQHVVDALAPDENLPPPVTLGQAIGDLPPLEAAQGRNITAQGGQLLTGHVARYNNSEDLKRFKAILPGESYRAFSERVPELKSYDFDSFADKFFKLPAGRPSRTIVAHLQRDGNGYIHPTQVRSITPREAARLQSFDDSYLFTGPLTQVFRQIGNAVPPRLAQAIAAHLRAHLERGPSLTTEGEP